MFSTAQCQPDDAILLQTAGLPLFDHSRLSREMEFDDSELLQELFGHYLQQLAELQQQLGKGDAIELSAKEVAHFSHRLKSSSHAVGAMQLAACLQQLELDALNESPALPQLLITTRSLIDNTHAAVAAEISRLAQEQQA